MADCVAGTRIVQARLDFNRRISRSGCHSQSKENCKNRKRSHMDTQKPGPAYQLFLSSMDLTYSDWHDGIGYRLEALKDITDSEKSKAIAMLAGRLATNPGWREIEALGAIDTPGAREAIRQALQNANFEVRMRAAETLVEKGEQADLESAIVEALRLGSSSNGFSQAVDMAERHPTPRIRETLLDLALNGNPDQRIHCAALALYLGGEAEEAFDWN